MSMSKADVARYVLMELLDKELKPDIKQSEYKKIMDCIDTLYDIAEGN